MPRRGGAGEDQRVVPLNRGFGVARGMQAQDLLDPLIGGPGTKGYPHLAAPLRRSAIAAQRWNLLRGDLRGFARTLQQGWLAKKEMASSISNPMIDGLEALGMDNGALATKV